MVVHVKYQNTSTFDFSREYLNAKTVLELKQELFRKTGLAPENQRLVYSGRLLHDEEVLDNIAEDSNIYLVKLATNKLHISTEAVGVDNNNDFMSSIMNSPIMDMILSKPDLLKSLFQSNPKMKEFMEKNPEFNSVFNDPSYIKQYFEMSRNPKYMREMLRNQDRALSNIESMPNGFQALTQLFAKIDEPLRDLESESIRRLSQDSPATSPSDKPCNILNNEPLPNPWEKKQSTDRVQHNPRSIANNIPLNTNNVSPSSSLPSFNPLSFLSPQFNEPSSFPIFPWNDSGFNPAPATSQPKTAEITNIKELEGRYKTEIEALKDMGFTDKSKCIRALLASGGNVHSAIEYLIKNQ